MKSLTIFCIIIHFVVIINAQSVGIGTTSPNSSAILDISSTTKGILIPRITTAQRNAIMNPAVGLQIFNLDDGCIDVYDGVVYKKNCESKWVTIDSIVANTWRYRSNFSGNTFKNGASFAIGKKGYIGSGINNQFWEFDTENNTWNQKANYPGTSCISAIVFVIGNTGYIGINGINNLYSYNSITNTWLQKANMPGNNRSNAVAFVIDTVAYVGTGNTSGFSNDFYKYYPSDTWTSISNAPFTGREGAIAFSIGNKGYVGFGFNGVTYLSDFWQYDPSNTSNPWTSLSSPVTVTGLTEAIAFKIGNFGYVGTGRYYSIAFGTTYSNNFYQFDPITNTWTTKANVPGLGRESAIGFSTSTNGYIGLGGNLGNTFNDMYEYLPNTLIGKSLEEIQPKNIVKQSGYGWTVDAQNLYTTNEIKNVTLKGPILVKGNILGEGNFNIGGRISSDLVFTNSNNDDNILFFHRDDNPLQPFSTFIKGGFSFLEYKSQFNHVFKLTKSGFSSIYNALTITGNPSECGTLLFPNVNENRKIVLREAANNATEYDGFGTNTNELRYNVASTGASHNFYANTTNLFTVKGNGNVGIGNSTPSEKLDVIGKTKTSTLQMTTGATNGYVMQSDASGNATWVNPNTLSTSWTTSGTNQYNALSGNVGIGTNTPSKKLDIVGTFGVSGNIFLNNKTIISPQSAIIDVDTVANKIGFGRIADGGVWDVGLGIGGKNGVTWGMGSGGSSFYLGTGNGTDNNLKTAIQVNASGALRNIYLAENNSGNIGIGTTTTNGHMQFSNLIINRKIVLYEVANNETEYYGFGINSGVLRYQTYGDHKFYRGLPGGTECELFALHGNGNATLKGTLSSLGMTCSSDIRLKKNILPIESSISNLLSLQGYTYNWIDKEKDQKLQSGLIAQEVEKLFPHLVNKGENGVLSVNYIGLMPYMLEAMKEMKKENEELKIKNEAELNTLKAELHEIKSLLNIKSVVKK